MHVLLPTDGAELSAEAIKEGIRFAKSIGAKVTGLCVIPSNFTFISETESSEVVLRRQAERSMELKELAETYLAAIKNKPRKRELGVTSFMRGMILPTAPSSG